MDLGNTRQMPRVINSQGLTTSTAATESSATVDRCYDTAEQIEALGTEPREQGEPSGDDGHRRHLHRAPRGFQMGHRLGLLGGSPRQRDGDPGGRHADASKKPGARGRKARSTAPGRTRALRQRPRWEARSSSPRGRCVDSAAAPVLEPRRGQTHARETRLQARCR